MKKTSIKNEIAFNFRGKRHVIYSKEEVYAYPDIDDSIYRLPNKFDITKKVIQAQKEDYEMRKRDHETLEMLREFLEEWKKQKQQQ